MGAGAATGGTATATGAWVIGAAAIGFTGGLGAAGFGATSGRGVRVARRAALASSRAVGRAPR